MIPQYVIKNIKAVLGILIASIPVIGFIFIDYDDLGYNTPTYDGAKLIFAGCLLIIELLCIILFDLL